MNTRAPELRALITIFRSVGPVISTRRSRSGSGTGSIVQSRSRLPRLGQEVWQLARAQPFLPLGAGREQLAPPRPEAPLELLDERHRFRSQHFLHGR